MRAPEVLDHRADLISRLEDLTVQALWSRQVAMDTSESIASGVRAEQVKVNSTVNIKALRASMREAEAFHVTPDMGSLVMYAASQLSETDTVDRELAPTRSGIARFEGGLPFTDVRGVQLRVSWIAWGPMSTVFHHGGEPEQITTMWLWNDHREEPDDIARVIAVNHPDADRVIGRWGFIGSELMVHGSRLGPAWVDPGERKRAEVLASGDVPQEFSNALRYVHAFFLLLGQTVASTHAEVPDRARRRRSERAGLPARVTVVSLRNVETVRAPGESLIEWSHRWVVRGFWRWQPCGKDHQLAQELEPGKWRARIWIAPYVKGPSGKPLVVRGKVYAVHR